MSNVNEEMQKLMTEKQSELIKDSNFPLYNLQGKPLPNISQEEKAELLNSLHQDSANFSNSQIEDDTKGLSEDKIKEYEKKYLEKQRAIVRQMKANAARESNAHVVGNNVIKAMSEEFGTNLPSNLTPEELQFYRQAHNEGISIPKTEINEKADGVNYSTIDDDNDQKTDVPKDTKKQMLSDIPVDFD